MRNIANTIGGLIAIIFLFIASVYAAEYITQNEFAKMLIDQFGYIGMLVIGYVSGLNFVVPIPGPTFTPIFLAAGFPLAGIVAALSVGSLLADLTAYFLGYFGRTYTEQIGSAWYRRIQKLYDRNTLILPLFIFLYVIFAPLPNEIIVIPLSLLGYQLQKLILPLALGTVLHVALLSYGATQLLEAT